MIYALIKNTVVVNVIVADPTFISGISSDWDFCIDLTGLSPQPRIGDLYDGTNFAYQAD